MGYLLEPTHSDIKAILIPNDPRLITEMVTNYQEKTER